MKINFGNFKGKLRLPSFRFPAGLLKRLTILIVVGAIAAGGFLFYQNKLWQRIFKKPAAGAAAKAIGAPQEAAPQEPVLVKVYKVQKRDFEDTLPLMGTIKGYKEIDLRFEVNGVIDSFNFKEGERIEEGEIIATLNQKDALLKLKYNEIELDKTQKLFDIGAIAQAKLDQVKLEVESAKRDLDKTYLYAPRSGVLGTKDAEVGEFVTSNDKIGTLIDNKDIFVEVGIVEKDIGKIKVGQRGTITVDSYPDTEFQGTVDTVSPVVEGRSRTQTAKIKMKNPKAALLPGMFGKALVAVYSASGVVAIPNTAIDTTEEGYVTYVVKKAEKATPEVAAGTTPEVAEEKGVVEVRAITSDYRSSDFFVVKEGLEEGDLVVIETQEKLKDSSQVIITEIQEALF